MPFRPLAQDRIGFRRGDVSLVAAASGGGKTLFMSNYIAQSPNTTFLYFSPDTGQAVLGTRLIATTKQKNSTELLVRYDDESLRDSVLELSKDVQNVAFSFESSPSFTDIQEEIDAYKDVYGWLPDCVVLDNVRDAVPDSGDPVDFNRHTEIVDWFHKLARDYNIACVLMAHLKGEFNNNDEAPGQKALRGQIGPNARLLLNVYQFGEGQLGVVVAKNSAGKSDAAGDRPYVLDWDTSTMTIK